ncbi:MAG: hypothetical protein Q4C73_10825 [Eubacteriales bacterium]|nr:hypothetical protein [Eubacteriales bacterium]
MGEQAEYRFPLAENGFVTHFLYTGRVKSPCSGDSTDTNQLRYEKKLRRKIAQHAPFTPPNQVRLGTESPIGPDWKYYYAYGDIFVDDSTFYTDLCKVEMHAATELLSDREQEVRACLFSCCGVDLWLNGEPAGRIEAPVYKPLQRREITLPLKKGKNRIYVRVETAGVRDTRISFALQLLEQREQILTVLPDSEHAGACVEAEALLNGVGMTGDRLCFPAALPENASLVYDSGTPDFYRSQERFITEDISGQQEIILKEYLDFCVQIQTEYGALKRKFEQARLCVPAYWQENQTEPAQDGTVARTAHSDDAQPFTAHQRRVFERIGEIRSLRRSATDGFSLYPLLARYWAGKRLASDEEELFITLDQIERRMDCADFMTCALIRFIHLYEYTPQLEERMRQVMLGFRYWMDEDGQDAMCFWSENHSLMFYQTAYFFGQRYPEEVFVRSGKTGRELAQQARSNLYEWFEDVCSQGFDEFNSGVYTPITLAAILNVVDFAEEELSKLARRAADLLFLRVAQHCFDQVVISPQGRIYRDVLYPGRQALQSLVHYMCESAPYVYSEWLICLATSTYRIPEECKKRMEQQGFFSYQTSNAVVDIYKTADYMLTSVESPRRDGIRRVWENAQREGEERRHSYVKSLNECFHGTMQFEPGVYGYQQHMWYAALSRELVVFANHPGGTCEDMAEVRPGYWFGNGITPALRQQDNVLGCIYVIPEKSPVHFTHLYWNTEAFDQTAQRGGWLFGKKGDGWIGVWCSSPYQDHDDMLFGCEKRSYGDAVAYLTVCGSKTQDGSFEAFQESCMAGAPVYEEAQQRLTCSAFSMEFKACDNATQYVD